MDDRKKMLIIDGSSLAYRAFYALPLLQNRRGEHTNAVYGFTNMLVRYLKQEDPAYIAAVFDLPEPTFRHEMYKEYKAHREETPSELGEQIDRIKEILGALGASIFEKAGYEADDIIGTLAGKSEAEGLDTVILTGDADLFQLITENTRAVMLRRGITDIKEYRLDNLEDEYGLSPGLLVDYRALKGDPSDNIPGVPGIGDKTAKKLLWEYGSLENVLEAAENMSGKLKKNLSLYREQALMSYELARIRCDLEIDLSLEDCTYQPDYQEVRRLFDELGFKSLLKEMPTFQQEEQEISGVEPLGSLEDLRDLKKEVSLSRISLRLELEPSYPPWKGKPLALAFAVNGNRGYYFAPDVFSDGRWKEMLRELFTEEDLQFMGHDVKILFNFLCARGYPTPEAIFDSLLAAYILDPGRSDFSLPRLADEFTGTDIPVVENRGKGKEQDPLEMTRVMALEARSLFDLREAMERELLNKELLDLYEEVELPLTIVLSEMERQGVRIDRRRLESLSREIHSKIENLRSEIFDMAGEEFNLNSPQQLSYILFEKLQLPVIKKTKTGYSTDARVLEELAPRHEIVEKILYHRHLVKLEGTYLNGILQLVDPKEEKIYTTFNQTVTSTGRLSSSDPNLQNIPVRLEEGRRIREVFVPSGENYIMLAADYSQIELRVLAHLSCDPILMEAFKQGEDIHTRTASEIFEVSPEEVTAEMRGRAKAVNFGIVYGMSDFGLAQDLKITRKEAGQYIKNYFSRYEGVNRYMEEILEQARRNGYVTTLFNRRRYLPEINSSRFNLRSFAERTARNTPIQGTAADIIKLAMLRVYERLKEEGRQAVMLLQVHDELVLELPAREEEEVSRLVREEMESAVSLEVPIEVEVSSGKNWYQLK